MTRTRHQITSPTSLLSLLTSPPTRHPLSFLINREIRNQTSPHLSPPLIPLLLLLVYSYTHSLWRSCRRAPPSRWRSIRACADARRASRARPRSRRRRRRRAQQPAAAQRHPAPIITTRIGTVLALTAARDTEDTCPLAVPLHPPRTPPWTPGKWWISFSLSLCACRRERMAQCSAGVTAAVSMSLLFVYGCS